MAVGWKLPILTSPYSVDLFIMISGFLMTYHYLLRQEKEPWSQPSTWGRFWIRRFMRIAPLYYLIFIVAVAAGPFLLREFEALNAIAPKDVPPHHFDDASPANLAMHFSFLFGLVSPFDGRSPLPDWSISLEMQFYAAFPFLMLLAARIGMTAATVLLSIACGGLLAVFWPYFAAFYQPSPLPMRLPIFLAGMLIAVVFWQGKSAWRFGVAALMPAAVLLAAPQAYKAVIIQAGLILALSALVAPNLWPVGKLRGLLRAASQMLGNRLFRFMADASYGVYLIHLLLIYAMSGVVARQFGNASGPVRFAVMLAVVLPGAYLLAALAHRFIEQPGIDLGRALVKRTSGAPRTAKA